MEKGQLLFLLFQQLILAGFLDSDGWLTFAKIALKNLLPHKKEKKIVS